MKTLVSGTSNGLGKYLRDLYDAHSYNRNEGGNCTDASDVYDQIIHCAFGRPSQLNKGNENMSFINQQLQIAMDISMINCNKLIFISSIDVFAEDNNAYNSAKRLVERYLKTVKRDLLIIRPGMLIGKYMKNNSATRICTMKQPKLTLTKDSEVNLVFYEDIEEAINMNLEGELNIINEKPIKLLEIAEQAETRPIWGNYKYKSTIPQGEVITMTNSMVKYKQVDRLITHCRQAND